MLALTFLCFCRPSTGEIDRLETTVNREIECWAYCRHAQGKREFPRKNNLQTRPTRRALSGVWIELFLLRATNCLSSPLSKKGRESGRENSPRNWSNQNPNHRFEKMIVQIINEHWLSLSCLTRACTTLSTLPIDPFLLEGTPRSITQHVDEHRPRQLGLKHRHLAAPVEPARRAEP